jgi:glutamate-ammonia-ligase adenylyltransferase
MRERVRQAHPAKPGLFDVKHSKGAMVDAEFVVQTLVLGHARNYPQLRDNVGNIALLQRLEAVGLLPPGTGLAAANAYRTLRQVQHRARLDEAPTQVALEDLQAEQMAIAQVWELVFPPE